MIIRVMLFILNSKLRISGELFKSTRIIIKSANVLVKYYDAMCGYRHGNKMRNSVLSLK
ncbi:Uncharacterised protein [Salmonella bongori]|nr:Uncharacterised protein [Salmonella bongori]